MNNQTIIPPTFVLDEYYYSISAILTIGIQLACYAVAATCKFDLITDFAGSTNFVVLSVLTLVLGNNFGSRGIAITVLVLFTRLYLAFFLLFRVCKRKKDARFDEVRGNCIAFLVFWVFQMFWVFLCMMPVLYINSRGQQEDALTPLGYWDYVGWAIFAIGIIIQVTADYQKYFFRKNPENKGQFMATGVWGYSRHPNYFGEILIWWGAFLCAIPVIPFGQGTSGQIAAGIVTILSPLFTMFILILGSGKYSRRSSRNVAVIIVRIVFISSFFFCCLLLNHSFPTNPNSITNCFKLFSLLQLTTTLLLRRFLIFEQVYHKQKARI